MYRDWSTPARNGLYSAQAIRREAGAECVACQHGAAMPIFLDRHDLRGFSVDDIAEAHRKDLECQCHYGVRSLTYWFDADLGSAFCLIDSPDSATAMRVHEEAHGDIAKDIIEVDLSAVEAFLGRVSDPAHAPNSQPELG